MTASAKWGYKMDLESVFNVEKKKFVVSIGDEGAILTLVDGGKLLKRAFATSPSSKDFMGMFSSAPKAPIYILVDVVDQAYIQHTLPPVSALNINKLVSRKLEKDFDENDIKAALQIGREKEGRKDWQYLFVSVRNIPPVSEWVDAIANLDNPFGGIYLLPVEGMNLIKDIKKVLRPSIPTQGEVKWDILVSHNRVGGFRQIVFKNGQIVFTRIAQPIGGQTPDVVAGNIEQETLNTIEYVRRLGYVDEEGLDVYIIASRDVKNVIDVNTIPARSHYILTPFEMAGKLGIQGAAEESDRFGDVVAAVYFANCKSHIISLHTEYTKQIKNLYLLRVIARATAIIVGVGILGFSANSFTNSVGLRSKLSDANDSIIKAEEELRKVKLERSKFGAEADRIKEITDLDRMYSKDNKFPLDFMSTYAGIVGFTMFTDSITMDIVENADSKNGIKSLFNVQFEKENMRIDRVLDDIDLFTSDVRKRFDGYKVEFKGLPDQNTLKLQEDKADAQKNITIQVDISSPQDNKMGAGIGGLNR